MLIYQPTEVMKFVFHIYNTLTTSKPCRINAHPKLFHKLR